MATNKPTKPVSTLPTTFGGTKTAYTAERISSGYEANVEEIIDGGNLNYSLSGTFERLNYLTTIADVLNAIPVGKSLIIDSNNRYDYETFVSDSAFQTALSGKADVDLSNIDATGQALFTAKVDLDLDNMNPSATSKQTINGFGMPNYSAAVSKSKDTLYTADSNGYLIGFDYYGYTGSATCYVYIDGVNVRISSSQDNYATNTWCYPIAKGSEYSFSGGAYMAMQFVPCIGG